MKPAFIKDPSRGWQLEGVGSEPVPFTTRVVWSPEGGVPREGGDGPELVLHAGDEVLGWTLRNTGSVPIRIHQVEPAIFGSSWPHFRDPANVRVFRNGFQSWTPTHSHPLDQAEQRPLTNLVSLMTFYVDWPYYRRKDGFSSHYVLVLQHRDEESGTALGFLDHNTGLGGFFVRNRGDRAIHCVVDFGDKLLQPGDVIEGSPLWIAQGPADAILSRYAWSSARQMRVDADRWQRWPRSPVGWCSWYEYYAKVRESDVKANLAVLARDRHLGVDFVQLDDGYQTAVGDWLSYNAKFPEGIAPLARAIRAEGFQTGLWTAPFWCARGSRLYQEHPAWLLRDSGGKPIFCGYNPLWNARLYALDPTHPEVLDWLHSTWSALVEAGYDYHKVDFLFSGLRRGCHHDPGKSPTEAYRMGLQAIRDAIGPDRFMLGCGAPLGPSLGFADGMRVSQDVKEEWDPLLFRIIGKGGAYPTARGALRNNITRSFLHRQWWLNDPDCLLVRDHNTRLDMAEVITSVTLLGMTGGILFLSDNLDALARERLALAESVMPPTTLTGHPLDFMAREHPVCYRLTAGNGELCALVNWTDNLAEMEIPGVGDGRLRFEFWQERIVTGNHMDLPRHGTAAVLALPDMGRPQVVGTTFHLTALLDGRIAEGWAVFESAPGEGAPSPPPAVLAISACDIARQVGRVWIRIPAGWTLDRRDLSPSIKQVEDLPEGVVLTIAAAAPWTIGLRFLRPDLA